MLRLVLSPLLAYAVDATVPATTHDHPNLPLRYHRALVPEEIVERRTDYLPMESQEFAQLIKRINEQLGFLRQPQIQSAFYRARFAENRLIDGLAELKIRHDDDTPGIVSLEGTNLAIREPRWLDSEEDAKVGAAKSGLVAMVPPGGGTLTFQWSLVGSRDPSGVWEFDVRVPASLTNRMTLSVPQGVSPSTADGLLQQTGDDPQQRQWQCDFGGNSRCRVSFTPENRLSPPVSVAYRQESHYRISLAGSELTTTIHISPSWEALRRVTLDVDPGLQIRSLVWNGSPLSWRMIPGPYAADQIMVLDLPQPLPPTGAVLKVSAVAALEFGNLRKLPTVIPKQLLWQQSTARISIDENVSLQRYRLNHGRQIASPAADLEGVREQTLDIEFLAGSGSISLSAAPVEPRVRVKNGVTLEFSAESLQAEIRTEFLEHPAPWGRLTADITPGWEVDDLRADPAAILNTWNVTDARDGRRVLEIELQPALASESVAARKPQLLMRAQRRLPQFGENISQTELTPMVYVGTLYDGDYRSLRATGSTRLHLMQEAALPFAPGTPHGQGNVELVDERPGDITYAVTPRTANTSVVRQQEEPRFSATTAVEITVDDTFVTEEFSIRCTPQNTRLGEVFVHLSNERSVPIRWAYSDPPAGELNSRRLAADEQQRLDLGTSGETWQLVMPELGTQPRTIRGYREFPRETGTAESELCAALAVLPKARSQRGTITVRSKTTHPLQIHTAPGVEAILVNPSSFAQPGSIVASYRYDPERHAIGATNAVCLVEQSATTNESCWAWSGLMDSYFSPDGSAQHRFSLQIENQGRGFITLQVPKRSTVRQIAMDETAVTYREERSASIRIDLPANKPSVQLTVDIFSQQPPWGRFDKASVEFPALNIPIVRKEWTIWLPPEYLPAFQNRIAPRETAAWSRTLFGRLAQQAPRLSLRAKLRLLAEAVGYRDNEALHDFYAALDDLISNRHALGQRLTWGVLLTEAGGELANAGGPELIIDSAAFSDHGIYPQAQVTRVFGEDRVSPRRALQAAGIVVLRDENRLILTTNRARALAAEHFAPTSYPDVYELRRGALAAATKNTTWFPTASRWQTGFVATSGWHRPALANELAASSSLAAWNGNVTSGPHDADTSSAAGHVYVMDSQMPLIIGWVTLIGLLGAYWRYHARETLLALAILLAGLLAFLDAPLLWPAVWALLGGAILCLLHRQLKPRGGVLPPLTEASDSTVVRSSFEPLSSSTILPALILLLCVGSGVRAEENQIEHGGSPSFRVLVPADENHQPVGKQVFLPTDFYRLLMEESAFEVGPTWLIRSVDYQAEISADATPAAASLRRLVASLAIETFRPDVEIPLPWSRSDLLEDRTVERNGWPVSVDWSDGSTGRLAIPIAGLHRLQVRLNPAVPPERDGSDFALRIPPVPQTALTLTYPDHFEVQLFTAAGPVRSEAVGQLTADLGPTDWLRLRWSPTADAQQLGMAGRRLTWLEVFSSQVFVNVRFLIDSMDHARSSVDVVADKRLCWLPRPDQQPPMRLVGEDTDRQRIRIELGDAETAPAVVPLRFFIRDAQGAGNLTLPAIQLSNFEASEHWLGVSLDDDLVISSSATNVPLAVGEFAAAWAGAPKLDAAFDVSDSASSWNLGIEPSETAINTEEALDVVVRHGSGELQYRAHVTVNGHEQFQHRLITPHNLRVQKAVVRKGEIEVPIRWSRSESDATHLFLGKPMTGEYTVELTGDVNGLGPGQHALPVVWLDEATNANLKMQISRAPNTRLTVAETAGFRQSDGPPSLDEREQVWRVASLQTNSPASARVNVDIRDNEPAVRGTMLTTIRRLVDGWVAEAEFQFQVSQGTIDLLAFDVPSGWGATYSVEPSLAHSLMPAGDGRQRLLVWLAEPTSGRGTLKIQGSLDSSETPSVPEFAPRGASEFEMFLRLPVQTKDEKLVWSKSQLRVADVPAGFGAAKDDAQYTDYRAVSSGFRAELASAQPLENLPWVSSREVIHTIGHARDYGVVTFHIEPAGLSRTSLMMPPGSRLLDASIAGVPAQLTSMGSDRWSVGLGTTRLPHRLRIAYEIPHSPRRGRDWVLQPPTLIHSETDIGRTLWTITTAADSARIVHVDGADKLSPLEYRIAGIKAIRRLLDAPDVRSMDLSNSENNAWFTHWNGYIRRRIQAVRRLMESDQDAHVSAEKIVDDVEQRWEGLTRQIGINEENAANWENEAEVCPPVTRLGGVETRYLVSTLGASSIRIQSANPERYGRLLRFIVSMLFVLAGAAFAFGGSRADWLSWLDNHTAVAMIVVGVAWWLLIYPAWLGAVIAAMGLLLSSKKRRPRHGAAFF